MGFLRHKAITPDMVRIFQPQPQARTVIQPQSVSFGLPPRRFQPFLTPKRSTRLWLTRQPCSSNMAVMRQYPYRPYWLDSVTICSESISSSSTSFDLPPKTDPTFVLGLREGDRSNAAERELTRIDHRKLREAEVLLSQEKRWGLVSMSVPGR